MSRLRAAPHRVSIDDVADDQVVPLMDRTEAIRLVVRANSLREIQAVLDHVRPEDHHRVLHSADLLRTRARDAARRAEWHDQRLPFGSGVSS